MSQHTPSSFVANPWRSNITTTDMMRDPSTHPVPKSNAKKAIFLFAQNTGESTFHLSITGECGDINVQFDRHDARKLYECLERCLQADEEWRNETIPGLAETAEREAFLAWEETTRND